MPDSSRDFPLIEWPSLNRLSLPSLPRPALQSPVAVPPAQASRWCGREGASQSPVPVKGVHYLNRTKFQGNFLAIEPNLNRAYFKRVLQREVSS